MNASDSSDSDSGILYIHEVTEREQGLGVDNQSDISVSSVHTSDLSDWSDHEILSSDDVDDDAEWSDAVENYERGEFESKAGPTEPLPSDAKPLDYFLLLFPEDMFVKIKTETETYAHQKGATTFTTSVAEIKAYLGMLFLMGVIHLPSYIHYWSKNPVLRQQHIVNVMTRSRFEVITKFFHVNDSITNPPRTDPGHDKLHKVRPVLENAKQMFAKHYRPHKNVAVDEVVIKFKDRYSLNYVPSMSCKWGIKAWAIADADSSYLLDFIIYTGDSLTCENKVPLSTRVVCELVRPLYYKYHHVYFDNFFTSVDLLETLLRKKTYACGTVTYSVRLNHRGLPAAIKTCPLKNHGDMKKMQKGKLLAVTWRENKKQISVLSTGNNVGNLQCVRLGKHGQPDTIYSKPEAIQDYYENYNAVNKNDQLRSYYGIASRAKKWWKYLFWFIADVSMINAYILYREAPGGPRPKHLSHLDFHLSVATGLIKDFTSRKRSSQVIPSPPVIKKPPVHVPTKIQTKRCQRTCVICADGPDRTSSGRKIQTSWECKYCKVSLCKQKGCFAKFHNIQN